MALYFPDVSGFEPNVDWAAVRHAAHPLAIVKASEGKTYVDPTFAHNWREMAVHGITRGAYHFARPQPGRDPRTEAHHFLRVVNAAGGWRRRRDFPLVLDIEATQLSLRDTQRWCEGFNRVIQHATGRGVVTYTFRAFGLRAPKGGKDLWLADYSSDPTGLRGYRLIARQFTDGQVGPNPHRVQGIGACDISYWKGDIHTLAKYVNR